MPTSWHDDKREKKKKNEDNEEQKTMDKERSESATVDVNEILNQMTLSNKAAHKVLEDRF